MRVALELLQWHHARSDGLFEGISKLHLAAYMRRLEAVSELLAAGCDMNAKGKWPSMPFKVTSKELIRTDNEAYHLFLEGADTALKDESSEPISKMDDKSSSIRLELMDDMLSDS